MEIEAVLPWLLLVVFWVVVLALAARGVVWQGLFPWLLTRLRRLARMDSDFARLREEVDRLSVQVDRLADEQSFMVRLLSDKEQRLQVREPSSDFLPPPPPDSESA